MKLERVITTDEHPGLTQGKVIAYMEKLGYQKSKSDSGLVFRRGSLAGSLLSSTPQKWLAQATVQFRQSASQATEVAIKVDVNTTGQMVVQNEKNILERELDGLEKILNPVEYESKLPVVMERDVREHIKTENQLKNGANTFFLIAGLSLVNSVLFLLGSKLNFLIGLGITQLLGGFASAVADQVSSDAGFIVKAIALFFNILIAGVFVLFGVFGRKRAKWSFFIGILLYALDALIFLLVHDYLSIVFHIIMLFGLFSGMMAIGKLKQIDQSTTLEPAKES